MRVEKVRKRLMNMYLCDKKATFKDQVAMWTAISAVEKEEKYLGFIRWLYNYANDSYYDQLSKSIILQELDEFGLINIASR